MIKSPAEIVAIMMQNDAFSQWMDLTVEQISEGQCTLSCIVKEEMLNGFKILHGGISYSIADSALAFASNSYGNKCVSIETSISHTRPAKAGEKLTAVCREINRTRRFGIYEVIVSNETQKMVGYFKGTVNVSEEMW